ncbi:MAG: CHASE domain-containing protein [Pseudomonadota bacterium]|nr:CHASE domain-containing protein [Pseudomonadota bacterium]MDP1904886.1 CHASE domain-containing protein [Pseudomonadota bacterium]MDP2353415.1 CHASE domain-containing protein [Pseudomonadota bacterium]
MPLPTSNSSILATLRRPGAALPWLVLAATLGLTFLVWRLNVAAVEHEARDHFEHRAEQVETAIRIRMQAYQVLLQGGAGLFAASNEVSREAWRAYVESLNLPVHYPGIVGMGYAHLVPASQREAHTRALRAEGFPHYQIWPEGERGEYSAVIYLEPFNARNRRAFGYDMQTDPARQAAMRRARDSGLHSLSGKVRLLRDNRSPEQHGFLLYVPTYRRGAPVNTPEQRHAALNGWVYAPFLMEDLMRGVLGNDANPALDLEIFDGEAISKSAELYDSDQSGRLFQKHAHTPFASKTSRIEIGGRAWTLVMHSLPGIEEEIHSRQPQLVLLAGLLFSLLLFLLTRNLTNTRARAEALAYDMTAALAESEYRYRQMFESNQSVKLIVDPADGHIVQANPAAATYYGYPLERFVGMKISEINTLPAPELAAEMVAAKAEQRLHFNFKHRLASGEIRDVEVFTGPVREGERTLLYSVIHDVTERNRALAEQHALLDNAVVGIAHLRDRCFVWINPKFEQMFGYTSDELSGQTTRLLYLNQEDADEVGSEGYAALMRGEHYQTERRLRRKDGSAFWVYLSGKLLDPNDPKGGSIWILLDISAQRAAQNALLTRTEELRYLSLHDPLTGLYNRRHMDEVLLHEVQLARRKGRSLTAIMLDIDHFKRFNDQFGHEAGDDVLREVGKLLSSQVRETDMACRYGGEEFLLLLPESTLETAAERAEALRLKVHALELTYQQRPLGRITVSLGVAELPEHAETGDALISAADTALYQAKAAGRDRVVVYQAETGA